MEKFSEILIGIIPVAVCYLCGALYLLFYLTNFGIYLYETNLTIQDIFFHSFFVFASKSFFILLLFCIPVAILVNVISKNYFPNFKRFYQYIAGVIFFCIASAYVAKNVAENRAGEVWSGKGANQELFANKNLEAENPYLGFVERCSNRPSHVVFADTKHRYVLCRSISRPTVVGRIFRTNINGRITGTWTLKR